MGTWTGQSRLKAAVGPYEMNIYFVVHLMPDPLRGYGCEMSNCSEIQNQVCIEQKQEASQKCVNLEDGQVTWSDVSAFLYFGARVDAGIPFNVHLEHNLGGWVGPLNMVMAQNSTRDENMTSIVDQYVVRYVDSPSTQYLHMHPNCSLFGPEDFERYMGASAVNQTVHSQTHASHGEDPYVPYLKTCAHGDVKPILPLFDFSFVKDVDGTEKVEVKLDYKILTFPHEGAPMYRLFPTLQERMNRRNGAFHISGPYCYGDDPKRGWTFDFNYDSNNENEYMSLVHGCVEGLPCLPSAAEIALGGTGVGLVHVKSKATTFGSDALLTIAVYALSMALLVSITFHCKRSQRETHERLRRPTTTSARPTPGPYGDLGEDHGMDQPLLEEDAVSESKEEEKADVQFV
jgi:hypothetical protein